MMKLLAVLMVLFALCGNAPAAPQEDAPKTRAPEDDEAAAAAAAEDDAEDDDAEGKDPFRASTFAGLKLRGIGPALMSGRVGDIAVDPSDRNTWYVAVASGGVWKTANRGTTFEPIFDDQGSYSIGCVAVDPQRPLVVWVGTGENNSQRSVGYGDGIYKSADGGRSFKNMGLKVSEHIGRILIDPRDSDVVYAAAQGPLWAPGGDRGLYKTTDGGETWALVLEISENTGVTDAAFDPRDPDVIYAVSYQRRRHVWTLINGGPESAIYKSRDGGASWKKLAKGLPSGEVGRIGLAVSPQNPDVLYALVEARGEGGGFYRSATAGEGWEKRSSYDTVSAQYYQEIFADPHMFDRIYSMDVQLKVSADGGKTFTDVNSRFKHVDNHALVFDPDDPEYLLVGCDGGIYESFDRGETWDFKANLPVTQFYKLCTDNDTPFYNIYGGTQDNNTQGGPSRTQTVHGITNRDWYVLLGGDGFKPQVDPENPDIVYAQLQYGVLVRYDRRSGERINIQPQPGLGEALRWNWDSALMISPHVHTRLYFGANKLFRSDDRGDSWTAVSPDLTRQIDRNTLEVMGRVWGVDAVAKSDSTSFYGNIVALAESPFVEGLIYAGTDDGLIQVTEDGGASWRRIDTFPNVPQLAYVADVEASVHDADTVYAAFNNHKMGDFKPYVLASSDRGRSWVSVAGDLPERGSVWALAEDHEEAGLLFAGTEFGLHFTADGGGRWIRLKGGLPVIAVRDLEIQRRENDLVAATFGRGFYVLDDFAALRRATPERLQEEAVLFPVKDALMYIPREPLGGSEKGSQGNAFFTAPNPPFGAVFTYYLKAKIKSLKEERRDREKKIEKEGGAPTYPTWEELKAEDREEEAQIVLVVRDEEGGVVRRLEGPTGRGFHRVAWDLRYPAASPAEPRAHGDDADERERRRRGGPLAAPGSYTVQLCRRVRGQLDVLSDPQIFEAAPLGLASLPAPDRGDLLAFQKKTARLQRAVMGAQKAGGEAKERIELALQALRDTPDAGDTVDALADEARALLKRLDRLQVALAGDPTLEKRNEPTSPSILGRVQGIVGGHWRATSAPTQTHRQAYEIAAAEFEGVLGELQVLIEQDLKSIEESMEAAGAPWTPGRVPRWTRE